MDLSTFLAQLFAVLYLTVGLGILMQKDHYKKVYKEALSSSVVMMYGGAASLMFGFIIVSFHNVWEGTWEILITLVGWMGLFKGFVLILSPKSIHGVGNWFMKNVETAAVICMVLGGIFGYYGFLV